MPELLSTEVIEGELADLPGWELADGALRRTWQCKGFLSAVNALNAMAYLAHQANHHPDLTVHGYNRVTATLTTHAAGGVTENDTALARRLDELVP